MPKNSERQQNRVVGTRPRSSTIPAVFRRRPMCRRVLHFTMKLESRNVNEDLELIGAPVFYNLQGVIPFYHNTKERKSIPMKEQKLRQSSSLTR